MTTVNHKHRPAVLVGLVLGLAVAAVAVVRLSRHEQTPVTRAMKAVKKKL